MLNKTKTVLCFFGTRPEAIKMAPVIRSLKNSPLKCIVGLSGQHTDLVDSVLNEFSVFPDFNLNIQDKVSSVEDPLVLILKRLKVQLDLFKPDIILVHGDTSTTLAGALAGFYNDIPVGHVEAGLRSFNLKHPWPEEGNRKLVGGIASYHFAPTKIAKDNLIQEGVPTHKIIVTGNTVVDALQNSINLLNTTPELQEKLTLLKQKFDFNKKIVILTGHRRENLGSGINNVFEAAMELSLRKDVEVVFPIHPNPKVKKSIEGLLNQKHNIKIVKPFDYFEMLWMLSQTSLLITDSGGLQEEAPSFDVPVLVTRIATERREALETGKAQLVGTSKEIILEAATRYLSYKKLNNELGTGSNPFGDGKASPRITKFIQNLLLKTSPDLEEPTPTIVDAQL